MAERPVESPQERNCDDKKHRAAEPLDSVEPPLPRRLGEENGEENSDEPEDEDEREPLEQVVEFEPLRERDGEKRQEAALEACVEQCFVGRVGSSESTDPHQSRSISCVPNRP